MSNVSFEVKGLKELNAKLKSIGPFVRDKVLSSAVNSGAQIIKRDAIARAPLDTGTLKRSIYVKRISERGNNEAAYIVGVRKGKKFRKKNQDAFYWTFVEFGTKHFAAMPFLRPAFEANKEAALDKIKKTLAVGVDKFAAKKP